MLSGELGVTVEATEHMLESGDAMYFDASVPHSYRRTGRTDLFGRHRLGCLRSSRTESRRRPSHLWRARGIGHTDGFGGSRTGAAVGAEMHAHLRRSVDVIDERKVLGRLNRRLNERGVGVMTTAVLVTYYPPRQRLTVSYAGHPTGWLFRAGTGSWAPLCVPVPPPRKPGLVDLPMGIGFTPAYSRHRFQVTPGDRMLLFTDGVLETT